MINRTNTVLAVLLIIVIVLAAAVGVDYSRPNIEILPDMKYTPAWEAFAANPNFPNGRTMQAPVPGTIARGQMPLYYAATKEDAVRAGDELSNPHSRTAIEAAVAAERDAASPNAEPSSEADLQKEAALRAALVGERFAASLERGSHVYLTFCISCHGPKGGGDGPVTQRGFPPPPSMLSGKSMQMKDGQLFHILTYGQGSMAPFAAQLSRELRWDVINYVRDLQSKAPPVPENPSAPENPPADVDVPATAEPPAPAAPPETTPEPAAEKPEDEQAGEEKKTETPKTPRNELRDET
jgi:mono/diheme cytochrome c family protein